MTAQWTTLQVPLAAGLNQQADDRAMQPPALLIARNVQFDEQGGLQTRHPFAETGIAIFGGGNLADWRRIVEYGNEKLVFTADKLYSFNAQLEKWVLKGTHLAIKMEEASKFSNTSDQLDCDRAELGNTVVYAWTESTTVYVAAVDKTTGAVICSPAGVTGSASATAERPRLVALTTKILLFFHNGTSGTPGALNALIIDPADVHTSLTIAATSILASGTFNLFYDATQLIGSDMAIVAARRITTTSYTVMKVANDLTVTTSTKARTCDQSIAIASTLAGITGSIQVVRTHAGAVEGDNLSGAALADVFINQTIGVHTGTCNQIAAAFRSVKTGGQYRCYVYWDENENDNATNWYTWSNWVNDANALGTPYIFRRRLGVASRAFDYAGDVYVWLVFAGASTFSGGNAAGFRASVQNTYFLYRTDAHDVAQLCGKSSDGIAAGYQASQCRLPGVALTDGSTTFSWCGSDRHVIELGGKHTGYADRGPRDISLTFDSNEARRTAVLGETLYISGAEILQYDGMAIVEAGFHIYPWNFALAETGGAGSIPNGTYAYKSTYLYVNAKGEVERSTTATVATITVAAGPSRVIASPPSLYATRKTPTAQGAGLGVRFSTMEIWRTAIAPLGDSPFFLATSKNPATANPNRYIANDDTISTVAVFNDELADASLTVLEESPENGSELENLAPPPATIIIATHDRLFLAGVAGEPNRIWYSKQRLAGQVAAFHEQLVAEIPAEAGAITALAFNEEQLVAFTASAIYALPGDGYNNVGDGQNFGPARTLSTDCGAISHETVARTPMGLIFKSAKGWYLLRGWTPEYIGGPVADFDDDTVVAVHVMEGQHQVRCLSRDMSLQNQQQGNPDPDLSGPARMLVWDYLVNQWAEWTIADGVHACIWQGTYAYVSEDDGPKVEQTDYTGVDYGIDIETAWIKLNDLQGYGRVRWLMILGAYMSTHRLRVRLARDYEIEADAVAATLATLTAIAKGVTIGIATNAAAWTATLRVKSTAIANGSAQNEYTVTVAFVAGAASVTVRDNQTYDATLGWIARARNVGILLGITGGASVTVAALEAALAGSALAEVTVADAAPTKIIGGQAAGDLYSGSFTGGQDETGYFDDEVWTPDPVTVGGPLQVELGPSIQRIQALKVRIGAVLNTDGTGTPTGEALKLTGLGLEVGVSPKLNRRLPASQKV